MYVVCCVDGVDPADPISISIAQRLAEGTLTRLAGIYTHGGHSYGAADTNEVVRIAETERDAVVGFAARLREAGVLCESVGIGSTPTCSTPPVSNATLSALTLSKRQRRLAVPTINTPPLRRRSASTLRFGFHVQDDPLL